MIGKVVLIMCPSCCPALSCGGGCVAGRLIVASPPGDGPGVTGLSSPESPRYRSRLTPKTLFMISMQWKIRIGSVIILATELNNHGDGDGDVDARSVHGWDGYLGRRRR